jgi:uncharacterized protein
MKNNERIIYGFIITIVIFLTATFLGSKIHLNSTLISDSFVTHSIMLLLSVIAIFAMKKDLNFNISIPKFKNILKPISIGISLTIVIYLLMAILSKLAGGELQAHPFLSKMNPIQILVFAFIYASIVEEILFRGFLLNLLKSLKTRGITLFNRKISLSVIISALAFGLAHLILIKTGVNSLFLVRVVLFASSLGLVAGYYQEKYDNTSYAIIVHMSGNSIAVIGAFIMSLNA